MIKDTDSSNSQSIGYIVYEGVEEVLGQSGVGFLNNLVETSLAGQDAKTEENAYSSFYAKDFCRLKSALESQYGHLAGQGILLLCGRASFKYLARLQRIDDKFGDLTYRLLPTTARMKAGIDILAETILMEWKIPTTVTEDKNYWYWWSGKKLKHHLQEDRHCFCLFLIGLLQEFTLWVSGGRYYNIEELVSMAPGTEACQIQVCKVPSD